MPLHLLGKKSWNVYNADNIARVRRDEAAAKAAEEAEEQRMQEFDAQRRLAILRGEAPPPPEDAGDDEQAGSEEAAGKALGGHRGGSRRQRKRHGEDDTDFELRLAKQRNEASTTARGVVRQSASSAPIVDHAGHVDLFGDERSRAHAEKNEEAVKESQKKKREFEDQYTMRFSNAAGKEGLSRPWYSQADPAAAETPSRDVWGNEDPRRKQREAQRLIANDPLALMKKGAARVRELKQERSKDQEERVRELRQLSKENAGRDKEARRRERVTKHRCRSRSPSRSSHSRRWRSRDGRDESRHGTGRRRDSDGGSRRHKHDE